MLFVAIDGRAAGLLAVGDPIKQTTSEAITGFPAAIPSRTESGRPSQSEGKTETSQQAKRAGMSGRRPRNISRSLFSISVRLSAWAALRCGGPLGDVSG